MTGSQIVLGQERLIAGQEGEKPGSNLEEMKCINVRGHKEPRSHPAAG